MSTVRLKIRRQDGPEVPETARFEEFEVPRETGLTVAGALAWIERHPKTADGRAVAPVASETSCLETTCGGCAMRINGVARLACSAIVSELSPKGQAITVEPLSKFPVVRDLVVDRTKVFDDFSRGHAWIDLDDDTRSLPPPRQATATAARRAAQADCTACGVCLEACPQYGDHTDYVGAATLNQVALHDIHPIGALQRKRRLETVMAPGGVADCGKAQICVEVCPAGTPLVDSIQRVARSTSKHLLLDWLLD